MRQEGTKAELLDKLARSHEALEDTIRGLDERRLLAPALDGWSVRDHLAHLTAWRRKVLAVLRDEPPWEGLGISEDEYNSADIDEVNAMLRERSARQSLAQVLAEFRDVHRAVVAAVEGLSEDDLKRPYNPYAADEGIAGDTWEHDDEHNEWIRALLEA